LYADFKHLGDQNHREKSCYVASEFIEKNSKSVGGIAINTPNYKSDAFPKFAEY
jgi:hypothetical protein